MPETLAPPRGDSIAAGPIAPNHRVARHVRGIIGRLYPRGQPIERRKDARFPFPFLVRLVPVDPAALDPLGPPMIVVGKELSERGMGFFHEHPLPYRYAQVTLVDSLGHRLSLLIELSWCRFTQQHWYDSGGRFLRVVPGGEMG